MKIKRKHISNIIFVVFIVLMIIPQTRMQLQVGANKIKALFSPSVEYNSENKKLSNFNWSLMDRDSNALEFESLKGQVIFVNLWATWCAPCVAEMPVMNDLYTDYKDKVNFLFVSNENSDKVKEFIKKKDFQLSTYQPLSAYPTDLTSKTIPATFIIGKDGTIHVEEKGVANWNSEGVRKLLDQLVAE